MSLFSPLREENSSSTTDRRLSVHGFDYHHGPTFATYNETSVKVTQEKWVDLVFLRQFGEMKGRYSG